MACYSILENEKGVTAAAYGLVLLILLYRFESPLPHGLPFCDLLIFNFVIVHLLRNDYHLERRST